MSSNYPPGVTGSEPEIAGYPDEGDMFGCIVWSDYLRARLVVVRYVDDDNWWFVAEGHPGILKARSPLSEMRPA